MTLRSSQDTKDRIRQGRRLRTARFYGQERTLRTGNDRTRKERKKQDRTGQVRT